MENTNLLDLVAGGMAIVILIGMVMMYTTVFYYKMNSSR